MRNSLLICVAIGMSLFSGCIHKKSPDRSLVVSKIREVAKLATIECDITKTIACNKQKWYTRQAATFMSRSEATVTLGIDLNKLKDENIIIEGDKIIVNLPPIEMINFSYPAEKFQEIERYTVSSFWNTVTLDEKDYAYRQGESAIREQIEVIGIEKTAVENTRKLLIPVLEAAGYKEIYIHLSDSADLNPEKV